MPADGAVLLRACDEETSGNLFAVKVAKKEKDRKEKGSANIAGLFFWRCCMRRLT